MTAPKPILYSQELDPAEVLADFRMALRARFLDKAEADETWKLKAPFRVPGAGQELAQIASVKWLQPGDWMRGYYRSTAATLKLGIVTVRQMASQLFGNTAEGMDPCSGGRMMEHHHGSRLTSQGHAINRMFQVNQASDNSCTGTQVPVALGLARASRVFREVRGLDGFTGLSNRGN
jgi:TPP-dependent pyruvate/acetoin dehydrogenase alpha subunit